MYKDDITKAVAEAYAKMKKEELKGNQHKIDANHNGRIDAQDFKILRAQKNEEAELEPGQGSHLNLGGARVKNTHSAVLAHVKKTFPNAKEITKHAQYGWGPKHEEAGDTPFEGGRPAKERKPQAGQKTAPEYSRVKELARRALEKAAEKKTKNEAWESKKPTVSEAEKMRGEDPCWKDYEMVGMKEKDGRKVPNCVPKNEEVELDEAYAVVGARENKRAFPGWLNVTRRGGKISSMDISRGEPKTVHDTEDAAKAHMDEIRDYLKGNPNHGWHTPSLSVKKVRKSTKNFRMEEEMELDEGEVKKQNKQKKNAYVASIIQKKLHPSVLPSLAYGRRELKKEDSQLDEKSVSTAQQKFMGMVYATKKGDMKAPSPEVAKAAAGMTKKQARDFAKTKHKGLPDHVTKEEVEEEIDESLMKSVKRGLTLWGGSKHLKDIQHHVKTASDDQLIRLSKGKNERPDPHTPRDLQTKLINRELKRRYGVKPGLKNEEAELEEAYGKPSKAAGKANWMAKFEDHVVSKAPEHRGKVDWNSATYLHSQGHSPEAAAEKYVASRTKSESLGANTTKHIGEFQHAETKKHFTYSNTNDEWAKKHGLPHEIDVGPNAEGKRYAHVKGTVAHVSVDENDDGSPKIEKWKIRNHNKYQRESYSRSALVVKEVFQKAKEKKNNKLKDKFQKDPEMEVMPGSVYTQAK